MLTVTYQLVTYYDNCLRNSYIVSNTTAEWHLLVFKGWMVDNSLYFNPYLLLSIGCGEMVVITTEEGDDR